MLAAELRDAVARRHALAVARVGRSTACPFDLHALVPVPADVLRLGPDHPDALPWLWAHWGTTQALRHVVASSVGQGSASAGRSRSASGRRTGRRGGRWRRCARRGRRCASTVRPIYELT